MLHKQSPLAPTAIPRYQALPGNAYPEAPPRSYKQIIKLKNQSNQLTTTHLDP